MTPHASEAEVPDRSGEERRVIPLYDNVPTRRFPVVTVALIAANFLVFFYELKLSTSLLGLDGRAINTFLYRAGMVPFEVTHRADILPRDLVAWWLTPLTAMFVHGGWLHIIFNMLFLWIFGNNVEDTMGRFKFLVFYLVCGLAAAGLQVAIDVTSQVPTIGASGAIAGVLGAYIVLFPRARVLSVIPIFFFLPIIYVPAWVMLGVWFGLQLIQGYTSIGGQTDVAFFAHIGGFVAGLLLVWVFTTRSGRSQRPMAKQPRVRF
jgi:membrane associated rhomboid family serine protease